MLFFKNNFKVIILSLILFNITTFKATAVEDGFGSAKKLEGRHSVIYYPSQLEPDFLACKLNISVSDEILLGKPKGANNTSILTDMLDTLFLKVCNILDMPLYSFQINIKVCEDATKLANIYRNLFGKELKNISSFYVYSLNTIYITKEDFKVSVLGHEIAHAIISHYFVVQPPMKVQEILAGYVEYQLRKR